MGQYQDTPIKIQIENLRNMPDMLNVIERYNALPSADVTKSNIISELDPRYRNRDAKDQGWRVSYNSFPKQNILLSYLINLMCYNGQTKQRFIHDKNNKYELTPELVYTLNEKINSTTNQLDIPKNVKPQYNAWLQSNRYLDIATANPTDISLERVGLNLGYTVNIHTNDKIEQTILNNVNKCMLTQKVFELPEYQATITAKTKLLNNYKHLVYQQKYPKTKQAYNDYYHVYTNRLTINSTSQKFAERTIAPYTDMKIVDDPTINFLYPKNGTTKPVDILNKIQQLLKYQLANSSLTQTQKTEVMTNFQHIYNFCKQFEGKNVNQSIATPNNPYFDTKKAEQTNLTIRFVQPTYQQTNDGLYHDEYGNSLTSWVKIGLGGVHGNEVKIINSLAETKQSLLDNKGNIREQYKYTSDITNAIHQDFASYYPRLLINLNVFKNEHGQDIYKELYQERIANKNKGPAFQELQLAQKLVLNSASGGADANFNTNIRCNNKALAMRLIGQVFAWYIGQSLAMQGARIVSINTDGLYTSGISEKLNQEILDREVANLQLEIEPENIQRFISKDANNRIEITDKLITNGANVKNAQNITVSKALDHAAICDYILVKYLTQNKDSLFKAFDKNEAQKILINYLQNQQIDPVEKLRYLQIPIIGNHTNHTYYFLQNNNQQVLMLPETNRIFPVKTGENNIYLKAIKGNYIAKNNPNKALKILKAKLQKQGFDYEIIQDKLRIGIPADEILNHDELAINLLQNYLGQTKFEQEFEQIITKQSLKDKNLRELKLSKVKNMNENQPVFIFNNNLATFNNPTQFINTQLDTEYYINYVEKVFNRWKN